MAHTHQTISDDRKMRKALELIKDHMTAAQTAQNRDLHSAINLIVDVARNHQLLDHNWSAQLLRDTVAPAMYACDACANDIEHDGVTDDEGRLELTGRTGNFYALCDLCAAPATHEVTHALTTI
ncbi:MAG TPA: hypothetical protein VIX19_11725 [Terriglobales bacterium]